MPRAMRSYATHLQKTAEWFGTGLSGMKADALAEPARDAAKDATPGEASVVTSLPAGSDAPIKKKGWPWPEPKSSF